MSLLSRCILIVENIVKSGFNRNLKHLRVTEAEVESVRCKLTVLESDCNPYGVLHGGQISNIVDFVSTTAIALGGKPRGVSVELCVSFLRPAKLGEEIDIYSYCLKAGRSLATALVEIKNSEGKMVAHGKQTKYYSSE